MAKKKKTLDDPIDNGKKKKERSVKFRSGSVPKPKFGGGILTGGKRRSRKLRITNIVRI